MQHWNSYWRNTKTLTSFAEGEQQSYSGDIAKFWQQQFRLLTSVSTILDIGTGNGGLAVLAQQFNEQFKVLATDAAEINPLSLFSQSDSCYSALKQIKFIGQMPTEHLALETASIDFVISQFGFEYAPIKSALLQINRVLVEGGSFVALVHHQDSFISHDCKEGIVVLQHLLQEQGIVEQLNSFASLCQNLVSENKPTTKQQEAFAAENRRLLQAFKFTQLHFTTQNQQEWFNLIAADLVKLIMQWQTLTVSKVEKLKQDLQFFLQRIQDQIVSAWSIEQALEIEKICRINWRNVTLEPMQLKEGLLCWALHLDK